MESGLYVVATPIGNLGDISQRALAVLAAADLIAAEDTRHSARLLQHFSIDTPMQAYHDHSDQRALSKVLDCLAAGGVVALVSDAGTPLISDPGYRLVRQVQDLGHAVYPVPGACAAIAALSASGLPTDRFLFEGFLPAKAGARASRLQALAAESATLVFYEAPHRVAETLEAMITCLGGEREALLARELTKTFETLHRAPLVELSRFVAADSNQQRGEIVLAVAGRRGREEVVAPEVAQLLRRLAQELPAKRAAAVVADCTGLRKKLLYEFLVHSPVE
ncbi:16S rRNA (cytidine(1402)-2'-O)-methyltransferase [Kineobactrum sediminis]|uniref:Ribosomal RNA small subunit methyltransferase I n=1 Tax=Kineobactrum sediminis TaxID=1905677 RepID=A0A2N5Y3G0_9GAMM|nr:16S rRNA (cytidine(1402)-2'-O)-methyltransferase [Kineobactrum sediminis]PLW82931.1 16S rRNA (cytidine(1402)-2'-O)-methyltransferase [Kineobactrum sediminis]